MPESQSFTLPHLIVCEGPEDKAFLHALIDVNGLGRCHIRHTGGRDPTKAGNTRFEVALRGYRTDRTFGAVRIILVVSDNDTNQVTQFEFVRKQIAAAKLVAPTAPCRPSQGKPPVTLMMLPLADEPGNLETICIETTRKADQFVADRVDEFVKSVYANRWPHQKQGKLWLRVALAARHESDPFVFLGKIFREKALHSLIPLDHISFDDLKAQLRAFLT